MIVDEGCKMTAYLYFILDTKRKALGFSRIHWQFWFRLRDSRDCRKGKRKCPSRSHGPGRSLECSASPHGTCYFCRRCYLHPFNRNHSHRALAFSLRFLYTTSTTPTRSSLSVITANFPFMNQASLTRHIEKKWAYVHYPSMHCRTCGINTIQSTPYN